MPRVLPKPPEIPDEGKLTPLMAALLNDGRTARSIARAFPELQAFLLQLQLDVVTAENRDECGPTLLALKLIHEKLRLFNLRGKADIQAEKV